MEGIIIILLGIACALLVAIAVMMFHLVYKRVDELFPVEVGEVWSDAEQ